MVSGKLPAECIGASLHLALGPAAAGLLIELVELGQCGPGDDAIGRAACGKAAWRLQALWFPLDGAAAAIAAIKVTKNNLLIFIVYSSPF